MHKIVYLTENALKCGTNAREDTRGPFPLFKYNVDFSLTVYHPRRGSVPGPDHPRRGSVPRYFVRGILYKQLEYRGMCGDAAKGEMKKNGMDCRGKRNNQTGKD